VRRLKDCFRLSNYEVVSIIGSGGKSSLITYLANSYKEERVLISTTTNILMPEEDKYNIIWLDPLKMPDEIDIGITFIGEKHVEEGVVKLKKPGNPGFNKCFNKFDKVFLESDGSRGLLLKGWADYEPIIVPETTKTIGVIPITAIGKTICKEYIHRLPLWLELADGKEGFFVSEENLQKTIAKEKGLWYKAKEKKILYISQVKNSKQLETAKEIVALLPNQCLDKIERIVVGDSLDEIGEVIHEK
jgi:probable selenium-dependent hydroxylase accessory protein YqeC